MKKKRLEALAREYLVTIREGTQHGAVADSLAIKPTELKVQGLDARLLKNAGFTAAALTSAGFSPRELKVTEKHKLHFFHNALFCWAPFVLSWSGVAMLGRAAG